jgi:hypothetical protein
MAINAWDHYVTKAGNCSACQKGFEPQESYFATLFDVDDGFQRRDYCQNCWKADYREQAFSFWQAKIPSQEEKRKLFVNDEILVQIFKRLVESDERVKQGFTFVLVLILMRKRLLKYQATDHQDGQEWWMIKLVADGREYRIPNPNLTEQELEDIREQLNEVLAGD